MPSTRTDSRCGQFNDYQVTENVELAVLQRYLCNGELLTDQTCSQEARRRCATLLAMRQPNSPKQDRQEQCLGLATRRPVATWQGRRRQEQPGRSVKTAKPKECFCCVTSSHSKSEYKNLSAAVKQKFAQRGRTNRHVNVEVGLRVRRETVLKKDKHGEPCSQKTGCLFPPWR